MIKPGPMQAATQHTLQSVEPPRFAEERGLGAFR